MEMTVEVLLPVLTLSHTARDADKVFKYFEAMLEVDTPRQGWAYSAVRTRRIGALGTGRGRQWSTQGFSSSASVWLRYGNRVWGVDG